MDEAIIEQLNDALDHARGITAEVVAMQAKVDALQTLVSDMKIFVEEQCVWPKTPESCATADELLARARQVLPEELQL